MTTDSAEHFDGRAPGYWFINGKLYVFEAQQLTIITGAPEARAKRMLRAQPWAEFLPVPKLVYPYRPRGKKKAAVKQQSFEFYTQDTAQHPTSTQPVSDKRSALDAFRFSLSKILARAIESFPNRQFAVIRCWQRHASFRDLLQSNRPLAFCVANPNLLARSFEPSRSFLKQREILEHFGFPNSKSAVQIVRRMCPESLYASNLSALRRIFSDAKKVKYLQHVSKINAGVLQVLSDNEIFSVVTPGFIEEVAAKPSEKYCARAADLVHEVLYFDSELSGKVGRCSLSSIAKAEALHTELGLRYAKIHRHRILKCRFPRPPHAGTDSIIPVRSPRELVVEGERQRNCVATYARKIESGQVYIYKVLAPQRATLSIRRQPDGVWTTSELRAACNLRTTLATTQAVEHWLNPVWKL